MKVFFTKNKNRLAQARVTLAFADTCCARRSFHRQIAAFSLLEVMFAVVVVGISVITLFSAFAYGDRITQETRSNLRASQILLEKAETIRLYSWDQITVSNYIPTTVFIDKYNPNNGAGSQGISYYVQMSYGPAPLATSYSNDMIQFTVTARWTNGFLPHYRQFTTYIARNGMQDYIW